VRIEFHWEARAEYGAAVSYYDERRVGLGARFVVAVEGALQSVRAEPRRWPFLEEDVRRRLTQVFPYAVLYTIEEDFILVVAVMHCHREPGYWKHRLIPS
jgi:toxin ParE1/3/4